MNAFEGLSWRAAVIGRWTARIIGTSMFLLFVAFFIGEGSLNPSHLTPAERMEALGMTILFAGLPLAWKWEGLGGLVTLAGFGTLVILSATNLHMWTLWVPAVAGAVHVASWGRIRSGAPASLASWRFPRTVMVYLISAMALFFLLCANEIFGQPPLMTPTLHPGSRLTGDWQGMGSMPADLSIHPDGSITGIVGETAITDGRITYGRSWFGRLLHMNSPYRITGKLSGTPVSAPFDFTDDALDGDLFVQNRPIHVRLTPMRR
jgi:hypothetical protein